METRGLTKKFGDLVAVDHIDIAIRRGEIFGLLGPNGAGKTTTIHMLSTILRPTEGTALVGGFDIVEEPGKVREIIGIVFQDVTIDRNLTGFQNMWVYGRLYGLSGAVLREKIIEALRFVGLEEWKDVSIRKYSGGMIRRLEIARSIIHEPEILFLDEPTLGLDPHTRVNVWEYIKRIRRERNITILMTTHYLEEADMLCDRLAIIDHGKIIAMGTPEELKSRISGDVIRIEIGDSAGPLAGRFIREITSALNCNARMLDRSRIVINVPDAPHIIPQIFDIATRLNITIKELTYSHPSLNDVFIRLTGRGIREAGGSWVEMMRLRRAIRIRRG